MCPVCTVACLSACLLALQRHVCISYSGRSRFLGGADKVNNMCYDYQPAPRGSRLHLLHSSQNRTKPGHAVCFGNPEHENTLVPTSGCFKCKGWDSLMWFTTQRLCHLWLPSATLLGALHYYYPNSLCTLSVSVYHLHRCTHISF